MADTFDKVTSNTPRVIPARTWNALLEAGQDFQRRKLAGGGGGPMRNDPLNPAVRVLVRNDTGGDLDPGAVVALGTPIVSAADYPRAAAQSPLFPATVPSAVTDAFAVLLDPLADEEIGRAVIMGVATCSVNVAGATDTYATPKAGDETQLESAATGPARILWREAGSSGTKKALVLLEGYAPAAAGDFDARLTTSSGGLWKFVRLTLDGSGAEVDDGSEVATFCASPKKIDGVTLANPVAGLRVRMLTSKQAGFFEFIPTGMAASGLPGLVSKDAQTISGEKTFEKATVHNSLRAASQNSIFKGVDNGTGLNTDTHPQDAVTLASGTLATRPLAAVGKYLYDSFNASYPFYPSYDTVQAEAAWSFTFGPALSVAGYVACPKFVFVSHTDNTIGATLLSVMGNTAEFSGSGARDQNIVCFGVPVTTGTATNKQLSRLNTISELSGAGSVDAGPFVRVGGRGRYRIFDYDYKERVGDTNTYWAFDGSGSWVPLKYVGGILVGDPEVIPTLNTPATGSPPAPPLPGSSPASMADGSAANNTIYYSTTAGKLVYKDAGGTVNNLY